MAEKLINPEWVVQALEDTIRRLAESELADSVEYRSAREALRAAIDVVKSAPEEEKTSDY